MSTSATAIPTAAAEAIRLKVRRAHIFATRLPAAAVMAVLAWSLAACASRDEVAEAPPAATGEATSSPTAPRPSSQPVTTNEGSAAAAPAGERPEGSPNACLMQGGERLNVTPLRGHGTEPFWNVRIEGRCVTYTHPDDETGNPVSTRVWTRYMPGPVGGTWSGALDGQRFVLRIFAEPDCSDGMSDEIFPLAVALTVRGELRHGCAKPI